MINVINNEKQCLRKIFFATKSKAFNQGLIVYCEFLIGNDSKLLQHTPTFDLQLFFDLLDLDTSPLTVVQHPPYAITYFLCHKNLEAIHIHLLRGIHIHLLPGYAAF